MLLLLQGAPRRSARELAEALEVSERTVYRDVEALCQSGIPVYTERGAFGGICLSEGYRKALTHFDEDEVRALFITSSSTLADVGLGGNYERALAKLTGTLSEVQRKAADRTRGRIHLDQKRWNQAPQPQRVLALLRRAVWEDRCVRLHYRDRDRKVTARVVEPFGLVAKAGVWYLVARAEAGMRTFRAERIIDAELCDESFARPGDFDLEAYWNAWTTDVARDQARFSVVARCPESMLERVGRYWDTHVIAEGGGSLTVRITFSDREMAVPQLVGWGAQLEILEPRELKDELLQTARGLLSRYGEGSAG